MPDDPIKAHWYLIAFQWDEYGKLSYCQPQDFPASLSVRDPTGQIKELARFPVHHAERTLGVRLAPDGNNDAEFAFCLGKAK